MKIKIDIWKKNLERKFTTISHHMILTDEDIEQLAVDKYMHDYDTDEGFKYSAQIDQIII